MNLLLPSSSIEAWFDRTLGDWVSYRRYLYFSAPMVDPEPMGIRTEMTVGCSGDRAYFVSWESEHEDGDPASSGTMNFTLEGNRFSSYRIRRDRSYFHEDRETISRLQMIDRDTLAFFTSYGGNTYREEIRFLPGDSIRLRQTVGFSQRDHRIRMCGQYLEVRA